MGNRFFKKMNVRIRAEAREQARLRELFAKAREKALKAQDEYILSAFADGQEQAEFWYDAFSMWGMGAPSAPEIGAFRQKHNLWTDDWCRAVWSLNKEQALAFGRLVVDWNRDWEYEISHDDRDYNAYPIQFDVAGEAHTVDVRSPNGHYGIAWSRN